MIGDTSPTGKSCQRPAGLVDAGFAELAKRWKPNLDAYDKALRLVRVTPSTSLMPESRLQFSRSG